MAKFIEDSNCFDDEIDGLSKAIDAYNKVRIINNPYTGNKKKMLITIYSSLIKNNIKTDTFLDLFSGSSVVGLFFNILGSEVDSNDLLSFPFITSVSFLENKNIYFTKNEINHLFSSNNSIEGFIFNNYTELSENRKFTKKEAVWLDSFRQKLSEMYGFIDEKITQSTAKNGFQRDSDFYKSCMGMTLFFANGKTAKLNHFSLPAVKLKKVKDPTGAGDVFAGALMGYIAKHQNTTLNFIKTACAIATVLASFCVEDFGTLKLASLDLEAIETRLKKYQKTLPNK